MGSPTRRGFFSSLLAGGMVILDWKLVSAVAQSSDKKDLMDLLDRNQIDFDPISKRELAVRVNGENVTGTEGGEVIFQFSPNGKLTGLVVWNAKKEQSHEDY